MKATGVIRRMDDLGRVVIPREIRRTLGLREGDPMEIFIDNNMVCFKVYSKAEQVADEIETLLNENATFLTDEQKCAFNILLRKLKD